MKDRTYPTRALAAYYRAMTRQHPVNLPIEDLPSRTCEATLAAKVYVLVCHSARTLAVYRVQPDGVLRRLKRWPKDLEVRLGG